MNQHSSNEQPTVAQRKVMPECRRRMGPAIPIAVGTTIGGLMGSLATYMKITPVGILLMFLGSLVGGLVYRFRSARWPVDPNARRRRFGFAFVSAILPPFLTALATGMRGQGVSMTILMALVGLSIATGVLVSGDRRSKDGSE